MVAQLNWPWVIGLGPSASKISCSFRTTPIGAFIVASVAKCFGDLDLSFLGLLTALFKAGEMYFSVKFFTLLALLPNPDAFLVMFLGPWLEAQFDGFTKFFC